MTDVHDNKTRSKNMRAIKSHGTAIEKKVSELLQQSGFMFREQALELPGKPDVVLEQYKVAIFIHGCFWHHHNCYLFKTPATRTDFWMKKIQSNVDNDKNNMTNLSFNGWRILIIWECSLKGRLKLSDTEIISRLEEWLCASNHHGIIDTSGIHYNFDLPQYK